MSEDKKVIKISSDLHKAIRQRIKSSQREFKTVEEYVEFVLWEIVKGEEDYKPEEAEQVKQRLRNLGYF